MKYKFLLISLNLVNVTSVWNTNELLYIAVLTYRTLIVFTFLIDVHIYFQHVLFFYIDYYYYLIYCVYLEYEL